MYADTGEEQADDASEAMRVRAVAAWTGRPVTDARVESVTEPDQWTVGNQLRNTRPLWKYSYPGGEPGHGRDADRRSVRRLLLRPDQAFMVGGTGLCVTALVLAWQALGKRLLSGLTTS